MDRWSLLATSTDPVHLVNGIFILKLRKLACSQRKNKNPRLRSSDGMSWPAHSLQIAERSEAIWSCASLLAVSGTIKRHAAQQWRDKLNGSSFRSVDIMIIIAWWRSFIIPVDQCLSHLLSKKNFLFRVILFHSTWAMYIPEGNFCKSAGALWLVT